MRKLIVAGIALALMVWGLQGLNRALQGFTNANAAATNAAIHQANGR